MFRKKNVLVLGDGYIASKIRKYSIKSINYIYCNQKDHSYLDNLPALFDRYDPSFVVNCYGFTGKPNVDSCEDHALECYQRNVCDTFKIMMDCLYHNVNFVTISTGCLYNDESGRVFTEDDEHNFGEDNPTSSVYSSSKSKFEKLFLEKYKEFDNAYLLRIRMPFDIGLDDKDYIKKLIKYDKLVNYPNSITSVKDLVYFLEQILVNKVYNFGNIPSGIYNVVNGGAITTREILNIYNEKSYLKKKVDKWYTTDDLLSMGSMKCRRSNCVLSTDKISEYYSIRTVKDAITDSIEQYVEKRDEAIVKHINKPVNLNYHFKIGF